MIADGRKAPDFELPDADGITVRLSALKGKPVVAYFYPADDTKSCTDEAKDFSTLAGEFEAAGAVLVGISPDSAKSHRKFKDKHDLQVRLLADEGRAAIEAFGLWVEKSMYGKTYMGVERATFLIDRAGKIARTWHKVKVRGHAEEVLAAVKALKK